MKLAILKKISSGKQMVTLILVWFCFWESSPLRRGRFRGRWRAGLGREQSSSSCRTEGDTHEWNGQHDKTIEVLSVIHRQITWTANRASASGKSVILYFIYYFLCPGSRVNGCANYWCMNSLGRLVCR